MVTCCNVKHGLRNLPLWRKIQNLRFDQKGMEIAAMNER